MNLVDILQHTLLNSLQAMQLLGLGPCLYVVVLLLLGVRHYSHTLVPILYFITLSTSFMLPLLSISPALEEDPSIHGTLLFIESMTPAMSFILLMQFLLGRIPPWVYWTVLAIPVVGGGPMVYASLYVDTVCMTDTVCVAPMTIKIFYNIFGSLLTFLLLAVIFMRTAPYVEKDDLRRTHKYWLLLSIIVLNVMLVAVELARLAEKLEHWEELFIATIIRITFIYLIMTSIFRVFDTQFMNRLRHGETIKKFEPTLQEQAIADRIKKRMEVDKLYREMGLNREKLAMQVEATEQQVSRVVNYMFNKSFNEFVNFYRVEEAKRRLTGEETAITVIGFEVGFNSIASFNRVFKQMVGKSPTDYRTEPTKPAHS